MMHQKNIYFGVDISGTFEKKTYSEQYKMDTNIAVFLDEEKTDSKDADPNLFFGAGTKYIVVAVSNTQLAVNIMYLNIFGCTKRLDLKPLFRL